MIPNDTDDAPIDHFSHCHVGIFAQLSRMGDLPALLAPAAQARELADLWLAVVTELVRGWGADDEAAD